MSKHLIQPEYGDEQADAGRGLPKPSRESNPLKGSSHYFEAEVLRRNRGQGISHFPCSADHEQDWQPYRLIHTLAIVVVDSHIQRIVLATEETTVTQQVSHRPSNANPACGHKEVRRSTGHIMVTTRYSDQQGSKSRQKVMRLYKQWHRPISKRFIKPPYSISRATSIDSECCRLPTTSVLSKEPEKLRSNQF